jgi:hypothetical protein
MLHVIKPRCPSPKGVVQVETCWDQSQQLYDLVQKVLLDIIATDPPDLPTPPVVTDGSWAAPGTVGEVWGSTATGQWQNGGSNSVAPGQNFVVPISALPAGDWDLTWALTIPQSINAAYLLMPVPPTGTPGNMAAIGPFIPNLMAPTGGGLMPFILNGPVTPISTSRPLALTFLLYVWPLLVATSGTYAFAVGGRRRR